MWKYVIFEARTMELPKSLLHVDEVTGTASISIKQITSIVQVRALLAGIQADRVASFRLGLSTHT